MTKHRVGNGRTAGWLDVREFANDADWEAAHLKAKQAVSMESVQPWSLIKFNVNGDGKFLACIGYIPPQLEILDEIAFSLHGGRRVTLTPAVIAQLADIHDGALEGTISGGSESIFQVAKER